MKSHFVTHKDITTAYYDEGEGPVLLLLHGYTGSKLDFHNQLSWFTDKYRVIVPDNRGHGETTNSEDESLYLLENLADDLHSFVSALGLNDIHLLGHSMGGMIVIRYALKHWQNLRSLLLMDTTSAPLYAPEGMWDALTELRVELGAEGLVKLMMDQPVSEEERNGIDYLGEQEHWARIEEKFLQMDLAAYSGISCQFADMSDLTEQLAVIPCPTTVLVGAADKAFLEASQRMAETIENAQLQIIPAAAHCPQYENAGAWRQVIAGHLDWAEKPTDPAG